MFAAWLWWLAVAFGASWLAVWILIRASGWLGLMDRPNHRSLHRAPVPRGGGAAFVVVFAALAVPASRSLEVEISSVIWRVLFAGLFVAAVGLADDRFGLPAILRLGTQVLAAAVVAAPWILDSSFASGDEMGPVAAMLAVCGIVAITNFYNFMDGADGVAGAQAVLSLAIAGAMASLGGPDGLALVCGLLAASVAGFLVHNWHPAEIFMGDSGSTFLGFVFGSLAASAWFEPAPAAIPAASWLCPLAPFLADTTVTLARRILKGERWYAAHRQHFYQWLIGRGWSHRRVAGAYLTVAAVLGVMSAAYHAYGGTPALLAGGCLTVIAATAWLAWRSVPVGGDALPRRESLPPAGLGHSLR